MRVEEIKINKLVRPKVNILHTLQKGIDLTLERARSIIFAILQVIDLSCLRDLTTTTAAMQCIKVVDGTKPIKQKERRIVYQYHKEFDQM
jgi:hypothetical protein